MICKSQNGGNFVRELYVHFTQRLYQFNAKAFINNNLQ